MIQKLSNTHGIDMNFWMEFESTVLTQIRTDVKEADPIDWLLSLADDTSSGFNKKPAATTPAGPSPTTNSSRTAAPLPPPKVAPPKNDWDAMDDVLGSLAEIQKL